MIGSQKACCRHSFLNTLSMWESHLRTAQNTYQHTLTDCSKCSAWNAVTRWSLKLLDFYSFLCCCWCFFVLKLNAREFLLILFSTFEHLICLKFVWKEQDYPLEDRKQVVCVREKIKAWLIRCRETEERYESKTVEWNGGRVRCVSPPWVWVGRETNTNRKWEGVKREEEEIRKKEMYKERW